MLTLFPFYPLIFLLSLAAIFLQVTGRFMYKAFDSGIPPVQWIIKLDPRGASNIVYRCKQVSNVL
jgi:hypothetical protein